MDVAGDVASWQRAYGDLEDDYITLLGLDVIDLSSVFAAVAEDLATTESLKHPESTALLATRAPGLVDEKV